MPAILHQIALVSETQSLAFSDLARTGAALQKQATRDLGPIWDVLATVDAFGRLEDVPPGYWPVIIVEDDPNLADSPIGGVHLDRNVQPFSVVKLTDSWQLIASHETVEMLVDPFGNRLMAGDSPKADQGRVEFLVEVCDPSQAADFSYTANGITVSDFYTPNYFDPVQAPGVRYSFTGAITEPRQVLRGGYLSWHDPVSDEWWQELFFGNQIEFHNLGKLSQMGASLRSHIDRKTQIESLKAMVRKKTNLLDAARSYPQMIARPSESKAQMWRAHIEQMRAAASGATAAEGSHKAQRRRPTRRGGAAQCD